ncbi:unnamed protein product [Ectocarpus sp. CCAP 1310/34]|nr:unnamed protein product [Ectocarpus sp. CCAP 1310/34]
MGIRTHDFATSGFKVNNRPPERPTVTRERCGQLVNTIRPTYRVGETRKESIFARHPISPVSLLSCMSSFCSSLRAPSAS